MNLAELIVARCERQPDATAIRTVNGALRYSEVGRLIDSHAHELRTHTTAQDIVLLGGGVIDRLTSYLASLLVGRVASLGGQGELSRTTVSFTGGEVARLNDTNTLSVRGGGVILLTSGTAGRPKRVLHGPNGLAGGLLGTVAVEVELTGEALAAHPADLGPLLGRPPHGLGLLCAMPIESIAGLSMANRALAMGETLVIPASLSPDALWDDLHRTEVTNAGMPPLTAHRLLVAASSNGWREPGLLSIGLGGAMVDANLAQELERQFECPVTSGYGSTELGGVALMSRPWDPPEQRWSTVGRPVGEVELRLEAACDGLTELVVHSPAAMIGTLSDDNRITKAPAWIRTGDSVSTTEEGALVIEGRIDYVIQRAARRIDPASIEWVLDSYPTVATSGVLAQPSRVTGEQDIWALVEFRGANDVPGLAQYCRERLEPHEVPRRIVPISRLPITHDGGPRRGELPGLLRKARESGRLP